MTKKKTKKMTKAQLAQIGDFAVWLKKKGSVKTVRDSSVQLYCESLIIMARNYRLDLSAVVPDIDAVVEALNEGKTKSGQGLSAATFKLRKATLKYWARYKGVDITNEFAELLKGKAGEKRRQLDFEDLLTVQDVEDIITNTRSVCLRSLVAMLWDTGCRPSEIVNLNIEDVVSDDVGFIIKITKGKSSRHRSVRLITQMGISHLKNWLKHRPATDNPALFLTNLGNRYKRNSLTSWLVGSHRERLRRRRGNQTWQVSPYLFRNHGPLFLFERKN